MRRLLLVLLVLALAREAGAHEFWLEPRGDAFVLVYGHGDDRSSYRAEVLKEARAFGPAGKEVALMRTVAGDQVHLAPSAPVAEIVLTVDTGYWVKTIRGWKNRTRRQEPRNVDSQKSLEYGRMLVRPGQAATKPRGLPLEIVPQGPVAASFPVQVLLRGRPLAGARLECGHRDLGVTDAEGRLTVRMPGSGWRVLVARHREPLEGDPDAAWLSLTAVLGVPVP